MSSDFGEISVQERWTMLRVGGHDSGVLTVPSIPTDIATPLGAIRMALGDHGEARLLLPIEATVKVTGLGSSDALTITTSSFVIDGHNVRFIDLICQFKELESVFSDVAEEILRRISSGSPTMEAVQSALDDFRELLFSRKGGGASQTQIGGLVGELVFLNRILDLSPSAWHSWRGPMGDRHDFRNRNCSVEIKTSLRAGKSMVTISSLEQLQEPASGELHLLHFSLEVTSGGMLSVSALGQSAMKKADNPEKVRGLILAAGCDDINSAVWNDISFRQESETLYRVNDGFPRLVPSLLKSGISPPGVNDVSYKCDLSVASDNICDPAAYSEIEKRLIE